MTQRLLVSQEGQSKQVSRFSCYFSKNKKLPDVTCLNFNSLLNEEFWLPVCSRVFPHSVGLDYITGQRAETSLHSTPSGVWVHERHANFTFTRRSHGVQPLYLAWRKLNYKKHRVPAINHKAYLPIVQTYNPTNLVLFMLHPNNTSLIIQKRGATLGWA